MVAQWLKKISLLIQESQDMQVRPPGWEDPLEQEMATHFSILARRTPWTEEPGGLQSKGLQSQTQLSSHTLKYKELCLQNE